MNVSSFVDFRKETAALPPVSAQAGGEFQAALPVLLSQIRRTLETPGTLPAESLNPEQSEFVLDIQYFFGATLASVFAFGLTEALAGEMEWMARTFRSRGIGSPFLRRMCKAWIIALHGTVGASTLKETVPLLERITAHAAAFFSASSRDEPAPDPEHSDFLKHLLENRKENALKAAIVHSGRHTVEAAVTGLFLNSLEAIGRLWSENLISVADEHLATANARWVASRFFAELKRNPARRHSVAVFSVPGDEHSLGAELLSRYLEYRGWSVLFLGQSMPESELYRTLLKEKPRAAVITVGMILHLPAFRRTVLELRRRTPELLIFGATSRVPARPILETLCDGVPASFEACDALLLKGGRPGAS